MTADLALYLAPPSSFLQAPGGVALAEDEPSAAAGWFAMILDQIDYGIVAVDRDGGLLHANTAARQVLRGAHPLRIERQRVCARRSEDQTRMQQAVEAASSRGMRSLLTLGDDEGSASAAVVPIHALGLAGGHLGSGAALLVVGKQAICEELSVQCFARSHGLTLAESQVLRLLCAGAPPTEIAILQCVAVSTIRTHIGSIRAKTGARNIGALVRQVAVLPPLVNALTSAAKGSSPLN